MHYVVITFRRRYLACICQNSEDAASLKRSLGREGIPCIQGEAENVDTADPRLREALGLIKDDL